MSRSISVRNIEEDVVDVAQLLGYSKNAPAVRAAMQILLEFSVTNPELLISIFDRLRLRGEVDHPDRFHESKLSKLSSTGQRSMGAKEAAVYYEKLTGREISAKTIKRLVQRGELDGGQISTARNSDYFVYTDSLNMYIMKRTKPTVTQA